MTKGLKLSLTGAAFPSKFKFAKASWFNFKRPHTYGLSTLLKTLPDISNMDGKNPRNQNQLRNLCHFKSQIKKNIDCTKRKYSKCNNKMVLGPIVEHD